MSKELKPYEKEHLILKKIKRKKEHQHRRRIDVKAIERGLERLERTYIAEKEAYIDELKARNLSIDKVEQQVIKLTKELKDIFPKPKAPKKSKIVEITPKNDKEECDICGKKYSRSGIKSHRKACLKKKELIKLQKELEKLEIEETLEELDKEGDAEIVEVVEEIIEDLEEAIDLDELTEDVSFIKIEDEEGD